MQSTVIYSCHKCGKIFDGDAIMSYEHHVDKCRFVNPEGRLVFFKDLKPIDDYHVLRALPEGMILINPTPVEEKLIQLYINELKKYMPPSFPVVAN